VVSTRQAGWGRHTPPLVIAHRGASRHEPENSLAAFARAVCDGADAVELDVMRCATGEVVVFHDPTLGRFTGDTRAHVRRMSYAALRTVDIGGGAHVPTLDEALESIGPNVRVNVELKSVPSRRIAVDDGLVGAVAATLARHGVRERALVSSFDPLLLTRFSRVAPGMCTGLLFRARPLVLGQTWLARLLLPSAIQLEAALVDVARVARWHARGLAVYAWSVDDAATVDRICAAGVDAIGTNDPAMVRQVLGRQVRAAQRR
jgi:glycerophosphoryl diester phosphodiesterase